MRVVKRNKTRGYFQTENNDSTILQKIELFGS